MSSPVSSALGQAKLKEITLHAREDVAQPNVLNRDHDANPDEVLPALGQ
jgi:hypothetical protein